MSLGDLYLGPPAAEVLLTPHDRTFTKKRIMLSRDERTADGTLVRDVYARKFQFVISYETIGEDDLIDLTSAYAVDGLLNLLEYYEETSWYTHSVKMQPFDTTRLLLVGDTAGGAIWSGLTVVLDEV